MAARGGTQELVATPSVDPQYDFDVAAVQTRLDTLQNKVRDEIHLHRGAQLLLEWESFDRAFEDLSRFSINGRCYLLVEPTRRSLVRGVGRLFDRMNRAGYIPIVAQVEQSRAIRRDQHRVKNWVKRGACLSIAAGSLFGAFGEQVENAAISLLDEDLVHFIASDGRSVWQRAPVLDDAYALVAYRWGERRARRLLIDNPWAALWGQPIDRPPDGTNGG